jgi:hypothetical protein
MADGFLGRWSKRKLDAKEGKPVEPQPPQAAVIPAQAGIHGTPANPLTQQGGDAGMDSGLRRNDSQVGDKPALTLDDVKALTPESDYGAFTARNVDPQVRNAAMKKLFTDPRYNVMDGLDTYIDDYSKPDPMPESMVRQLASAKFLKLFEREEEGSPPGDDLNNPAAADVAQSGLCKPLPSPADDAHPDLRLQPDDAPPGKSPGDGAG